MSVAAVGSTASLGEIGTGRDRRIVRDLTRVEGRMLLRHPVMIAGIALGVFSLYAPIVVAAATLIVAHLSTSRGDRHGTEEVYGMHPARLRARTEAHLLAVGAAVVVTVPLWAAHIVFWMTKEQGLTLGPAPAVAIFAAGLARVALMGTSGVLLARVIPSPVAGPVAVVGFLFLSSFDESPLWLWFEPGVVQKTLEMVVLTIVVVVVTLLLDRRGGSGVE